MHDVQNKLRQAARRVLESRQADVVIGFETGSLPGRARPCFVRDAAATDRLVWNRFCTNNLAVYLPRLFEKPAGARDPSTPPKVAVTAKACDIRSIVALVKERQVPRANVVIIGMPCPGMADPAKVRAAAGRSQKLDGDDLLAEACLQCHAPAPAGADIVIDGPSRQACRERFERVRQFESLSAKERWERFEAEISKCIRCYACRQACPNCYCKTCFIDQTKPSWAGVGDDPSDLLLFHVGRVFHQAGRCVECDACVHACPVGVDLRLFTQKLVKDVEELFGYVPGASGEEPPPLATFRPDDNESFITDPQES